MLFLVTCVQALSASDSLTPLPYLYENDHGPFKLTWGFPDEVPLRSLCSIAPPLPSSPLLSPPLC